MRRLSLFFVVFTLIALTIPAFALSGDVKADFDEFVRNIREEKRIDQIGYLVLAKLAPSRLSEEQMLRTAGKFFYSSSEGYLTHVNFVRLERLRKANVKYSILDKKRLDDRSENWYMVWVETPAQEARLRSEFEPLFTHDKTFIIRVRPEDEELLNALELRYSVLDETLVPLRVPVWPSRVKAPKFDPAIADQLTGITVSEMVTTVETLENFKSRHVKQPGNAAAVKWLAEQFDAIDGLEVTTPEFNTSSGKLQNVVAIQKGTEDPNTVFVVCGHMDSTVSNYNFAVAPGADDNGTGAAGVLHVARVAGKLPLPYTVIYAAFNAEEAGLLGSKALAKTLAAQNGIQFKAVLNMDMIADRDDNEVAVIGNTRSNWLIDVFKDTALAYTGLKSKTLYDSNIWYSDHSSFWNIGASAILTIEGYPEMSKHYHKASDLVANLEPTLMEKIARSQLAVLLTLNRATNFN
ncbi:MAG TPA: M28 family metallopeptidase [Candidatus Ozemobacteraceae bacterium]|nr:M28 family metallopeptidase [Candidatus Ozemobacteraceae bacterium]